MRGRVRQRGFRNGIRRTRVRVPVEMHVFHISSIVINVKMLRDILTVDLEVEGIKNIMLKACKYSRY